MMVYYSPLGGVVAGFDWCWPCEERTPQSHPYSYDAHFLWREFSDEDRENGGIINIYSDRMASWRPEKYEALMRHKHWPTLSFGEAHKIIDGYFNGEQELVGYAIECNPINGYHTGIFWVRKKDV